MSTLRKCVLAVVFLAALCFYPSSDRWQALAQTACAGVPFTDVPANICSAVSSLYYTGITLGTSTTTYSPNDNVTRGQMALFLSRAQDQVAKRSRRGALGWFHNPQNNSLQFTTIPGNPTGVSSDGVDLWVASGGTGTVTRVRASDGRVLETWTGAPGVGDVLAVNGRVYASSNTALYMIDPSQPAGAMTKTDDTHDAGMLGLTFDGTRIWRAGTTNAEWYNTAGAFSQAVGPLSTANRGIIFDGSSTWVITSTSLRKNTAGGLIFDSTDIAGGFSSGTGRPCFDGINLLLPDGTGNRVVVFRPAAGQVVGTLTGNGLSGPKYVAFDGERIGVVNGNGTVSLFRAADFSPLGVVTISAGVLYQIASDGLNFWVLDATNNRLYRL